MKTAEEWALENGAYKPQAHSNVYGYCEFDAENFVVLVKQIQLDELDIKSIRALRALVSKSCEANDADCQTLKTKENQAKALREK